MIDLVVIAPFESWRIGQRITNDALIVKVLAAHATDVVKVTRPVQAAPVKKVE